MLLSTNPLSLSLTVFPGINVTAFINFAQCRGASPIRGWHLFEDGVYNSLHFLTNFTATRTSNCTAIILSSSTNATAYPKFLLLREYVLSLCPRINLFTQSVRHLLEDSLIFEEIRYLLYSSMP